MSSQLHPTLGQRYWTIHLSHDDPGFFISSRVYEGYHSDYKYIKSGNWFLSEERAHEVGRAVALSLKEITER